MRTIVAGVLAYTQDENAVPYGQGSDDAATRNESMLRLARFVRPAMPPKAYDDTRRGLVPEVRWDANTLPDAWVRPPEFAYDWGTPISAINSSQRIVISSQRDAALPLLVAYASEGRVFSVRANASGTYYHPSFAAGADDLFAAEDGETPGDPVSAGSGSPTAAWLRGG
jgi:hypothetical protein